MPKNHRKIRGRVVLLLGVLMPMIFLTPLSMTGAGAASPVLTPAPQAITNAISQACATGVYTEPSTPGVAAALVGKSVQVSGCSQFAPTSAVANGKLIPLSGEPGGYCTSGSAGFDNGNGTQEYGYTIQSCTANVALLQAWNNDYWKADGLTGWYYGCAGQYALWNNSFNDSDCINPGSWADTYWRVRGQSEIVLPAGYEWVTVQPGCTGEGTGTELCTAGATGFLAYWNA